MRDKLTEELFSPWFNATNDVIQIGDGSWRYKSAITGGDGNVGEVFEHGEQRRDGEDHNAAAKLTESRNFAQVPGAENVGLKRPCVHRPNAPKKTQYHAEKGKIRWGFWCKMLDWSVSVRGGRFPQLHRLLYFYFLKAN